MSYHKPPRRDPRSVKIPSGRPPRSGPGGRSGTPSWRWSPVLLVVVGVVVLMLAGGGGYWLLSGDGSDEVPTPSAAVPSATTTVTSTQPLSGTTVAATSETLPVPTATQGAVIPPDVPRLQQLLVDVLNEERRGVALTGLASDRSAAVVAARHANEMSRYGYRSSWDLNGHGPSYRYTAEGGLDAVFEYVYLEQPGGVDLSTHTAWETYIRQLHTTLMKQPEYKDLVHSPQHTHVGAGVSYNLAEENLAVVLEFVNHYVRLEPMMQHVSLGETLTLAGQLEPGVQNPVLELAYEPMPTPVGVAELEQRGGYESPAVVYATVPLTVDGDGRFRHEVTLNYEGQSGLYHMRVRVDVPERGSALLATDVVVEVQ